VDIAGQGVSIYADEHEQSSRGVEQARQLQRG